VEGQAGTLAKELVRLTAALNHRVEARDSEQAQLDQAVAALAEVCGWVGV
jgi:hypothetical protein